MKISQSAEPQPPEEATAPPAKPKGTDFAAVLKSKRKGNDDQGDPAWPDDSAPEADMASSAGRTRGMLGDTAGGNAKGASSAALQALPQPLTPSQQRVEKPQSTMDSRQLDGLVQEISVAAQDKSTQVDIQLNSQTLQGLHIRIASDPGGSIAIQFTTASAAVSEFLSGNIQQLSNALAERDIKVSEIRVARREAVSGALRQKNSGGRQRER